MNSIKEMMEAAQTNSNPAHEPQKPTREQLEANIKISHNWMTAVGSGTYHGNQSLHIATLLDFLQTENKKAVSAYEAAFPADVKFEKHTESERATA